MNNNVKPDKNIKDELQEIAPVLAKLDKANLYQVQQGYFQAWQINLIHFIETGADLHPVLSTIPKKQFYSAPPATYFESSADEIVAKVHAEEVAEELAYTLPVLEHVVKKELYSVPASYFEAFVPAIVKQASRDATQPHLLTATLFSKLARAVDFLTSLLLSPRYTIFMASVMSIIVCIVLVVKPQSTLSSDDKIFAQMQQLPNADLHHYFAKHRDDFDERSILHNINNVDFTHYFDKPEQVTPHIESHIKNGAEEEINEEILD